MPQHATIVASSVKTFFRYSLRVVQDLARDAICSHVARLLREERLRQKLSLNVLAARAGLSRQMVSYIETEDRNPSLETLLRITFAMGVNLDDVIMRARLAVTGQ